MDILKSFLRWTHRIFWYTVAGSVIALAIAISLVRIFIPDVKLYREKIEHVASAFLAQEVRIDSMDARLSGITPMIIFKGVRMLDHTGKHEIMQFDEARLGLDLWHSLTNRKVIPKNFTVYGVKLGITRRKDRTLSLQGLNVAKFEKQINMAKETVDSESSELAKWIFERSTLVLKHSTVVWHDTLRGNKTIRFDDVNLDMRNDGDRHQFSGAISLPRNMGSDLAVAFDFRGNILDPAQWQGQFYARGRALQVGNWGIKPAIAHTTLDEGKLDFELWGEWQAGSVTSLTTNTTSSAFHLSVGEKKKPLEIKLVSGLFDWRKQSDGWRLNVSNFRYQGQSEIWPQSKVNIVYHQGGAQADSIDAYSSYLQLADTAHLINDLAVLDKTPMKLLRQLSPRGELSDMHVQLQLGDQPKHKAVVSTRFKDLSIKPYKSFPGIDGLDGSVWTNQQHGVVKFADSSLQLALPTLFREPFAISQLDGEVQWWHAYDAWHISTPELAVANSDIQTDFGLEMSFPDNGASPFLDLQAHFTNGDAQHISRYLPVSIMDPELVDWLDHGIVSGRVKAGNALFHGRLANFPFPQQHGTFVVDFQGEDILLDYRKGWPRIVAKALEANFTGSGMSLQVSSGTLYHTRLYDTTVAIDQFMLPVLTVAGKFNGDTDDAVRFLVESPIAPGAASFYKQSQISGETAGGISLSIPLSDDAKKTHSTTYQGDVELKRSQLQAWNQQLEVNNISGHLHFSPSGVYSKQLSGWFSGQPTQFNVTSHEVKQQQIIDVSMQGMLDMAKLTDKLQLSGLEKRLSGKTRWQGMLRIGDEEGIDPGMVSLHITSHLQGLRIDLPPPLRKAPQDYQDLDLSMKFTEDERIPLDLTLGNTLNAALLLQAPSGQPLQLEKGVLQFSAQPAVLPAENQLVIRGSIPEFPLDEWQAIIHQLASDQKVSALDQLGLPVILDLGYLNITSHQDVPTGPAEDPHKVSSVNGEIHDLVYNDLHLGHLLLKTSRDPDGLRIDQIKIDSPIMQITGQGSWLLRQGKQRTNILLSLKTENLGNMISRLGYKGVIKNGKAKFAIQLNWPDSPNRFNVAKLNGTLGVVIDNGTLSDVNPGAGKVIGLLSLTELPRHLVLDFSDMGHGLQFKQILGQLDIVDGDAFTENLHIISTIALIDIDGRTGLAKRDYDLDVSVAPNVSNTLPVISWLAWGGQIGALTFVIDQLFGKKFNESIATAYRVTGSWEKPEIKVIPSPKQQETENK